MPSPAASAQMRSGSNGAKAGGGSASPNGNGAAGSSAKASLNASSSSVGADGARPKTASEKRPTTSKTLSAAAQDDSAAEIRRLGGLKPLVALLQNKNPDVQKYAAVAVGNCADDGTQRALSVCLSHSVRLL